MIRLRNIIPGLLLLLTLTGCTLGRMLVFNFADIRDHKKFPYREMTAPAEKFSFIEADAALEVGKKIRVTTLDSKKRVLDDYLPETKTVAFLVIRNDSLLYERYFNDYDVASIVPSFSMAKSFTSALFGIALSEGHIKSVEDSMTQYLPELRGKGMEKIKLRHLLKMTTGIRHQESYSNPFSGVAKAYYGHNLRNQVKNLKVDHAPGIAFEYQSISTQLLGAVIERATGKTLTSLLNEKIWQQTGMEYDGTWSIDKKNDGMEKAFCCINARARDFAKFGRLYLNKGNWNGTQIIPESWVKESTKVDARDGAAWYYQHQWWLPSREGDFVAHGHLGQFIYVNPEKNTVIVRLGKSEADVNWPVLFREIIKQF